MPQQLRLLTLNDVKLVGRLTKDPELRYTTQGTPICRFRLAVGRSYKDKATGEWKEEVAFVPCLIWRDQGERAGQRLKKGSPVYVEGRLKSRDWETKEGQKRFELELDVQRVQFLEAMGEAVSEGEPSESAISEAPVAVGAGRVSENLSSSDQNHDEEVPF